MTPDEISTLLRRTASGLDVRDAPVEEIVRTGRRRARRRIVAQVAGTVAAVAVVAVLVPLGIGTRPIAPAAAPGCAAEVAPAVLPEWARTGFTAPEPAMPYVLGDGGHVAAILFGPLTSPPEPGRNNKILWVAREPASTGPLLITARRSPGDPPVVREVPGGPGPSAVDLPAPGCWTLDLRWGERTDTVRLNYLPG
ncbi:hypothetical protein [Pseudonocardia alaniniphila]|uniref:Anti-sigma-K factor rskA n=1 Tax=Pseudonocardia alaniniphila TaxID=75291 RepID=A0ABS9TJB5_9PSEU|nr:hypothetical protein [Pseudonocardia alaniniphila]MCH6168619.1 hypothetical protein [Pseudonocardia alaniniphila]